MKVFISWSGSRSKVVAEIFRDWIKCVIQASRPWVSTRDIDRGSLWFSEINDQLKDTAVGIVCLTQENKNRPWILFEAGALAKGLTSSRVCTFLIDMKPTDLEDPLAQFNHTYPDRDSMWSLVRTINGCQGPTSLDERILEQVFQTYWSQFEEKFKKALELNPIVSRVEPRSEQNILTEILESTRYLSHRLRRLEEFQERGIRPRNPGFRHLIRDLLRSGTPPEVVFNKFKGSDIPENIIMSEIERYLSEKGSVEKDDDPSKGVG